VALSCCHLLARCLAYQIKHSAHVEHTQMQRDERMGDGRTDARMDGSRTDGGMHGLADGPCMHNCGEVVR
jgi:hypothetical protein